MLERVFKSAMKSLPGLAAGLILGLPDRWLRLLFGSPPAAAAGLRPDAWAICRLAATVEEPADQLDPARERARTDRMSQAVAAEIEHPVVTEDIDLRPDGEALAARLYTPAGVSAQGPLLIWFHGGGWVVGSLDSHESPCHMLAVKARVRVLSIDYRLAPEHPFPAAPEDALAAWTAVEEDPPRFGTEPGGIAVGGDSAGGNLAAVLCQDLKGSGASQPKAQVLLYPVTEIGSQRESMSTFSSGFLLTRQRMEWFNKQYVPAGAEEDPRAAPLLATDLTGLAPAYVSTSEADILRDEGEAYARRLMEAGVEVRYDRLPVAHSWFNQTRSRSARTAHGILASNVKSLLNGST
jgi:acetyl esterase